MVFKMVVQMAFVSNVRKCKNVWYHVVCSKIFYFDWLIRTDWLIAWNTTFWYEIKVYTYILKIYSIH